MQLFRLPFSNQRLPNFLEKLILVGDLIREPIAHEIALKISETSYLPVRSYGIEQFLHGPRVTLDKESSIIGLFTSLSSEFNWLAQLVWGQYLALELAKSRATNPDTVRKKQQIYAEAGKYISL